MNAKIYAVYAAMVRYQKKAEKKVTKNSNTAKPSKIVIRESSGERVNVSL